MKIAGLICQMQNFSPNYAIIKVPIYDFVVDYARRLSKMLVESSTQKVRVGKLFLGENICKWSERKVHRAYKLIWS